MAQYNLNNLQILCDDQDLDEVEQTPDDFNVSYTYKNLRLYPIIANDNFIEHHSDIGEFTLLKDAIESKKIRITETGSADNVELESNDQLQENNQTLENNQTQRIITQNIQSQSNNTYGVSGTVNTLIAENISSDTIFIMAGEVVKGGKQDRVIAQDVILSPNEKIDLSAFCVEKNRWATKNENKGAFTGYFNVTSMDIRESITEEKNQSEVWRKVAKHTTINDARSSTNTYTNLENSDEYQKDVEKYMAKFGDAFINNKSVIGFVAVTGNEIIGCDMFATNDLFINSYQNLIHSYIGHSITNGSEITISNQEVFSYLNDILINEKEQEDVIEKNGTLYKWKDKKLHITTY